MMLLRMLLFIYYYNTFCDLAWCFFSRTSGRTVHLPQFNLGRGIALVSVSKMIYLSRRMFTSFFVEFDVIYPLGIVQLYCSCSETSSPWVSFTSYLLTLSFQGNEVGATDTKPRTGHFSSRKKFFPTWGVPGIAKRGSGSAH